MATSSPKPRRAEALGNQNTAKKWVRGTSVCYESMTAANNDLRAWRHAFNKSQHSQTRGRHPMGRAPVRHEARGHNGRQDTRSAPRGPGMSFAPLRGTHSTP